jgi:hypothetical protein
LSVACQSKTAVFYPSLLLSPTAVSHPYFYANANGRSYPTSRDFPQLLLSKTAVPIPNNPPFLITPTTNPRHNCQNLRHSRIAGLRTDFSCSGAFGLTNLVFNIQTTNFDAGKPFPAKTYASQEH